MRAPTPGLVLAGLVFLAGCRHAGQPTVTDQRSAGGLAYDLVGEGPLVVLIHGSNLDRRMWAGEVAWLRGSARVLAYDLRGQGGSVDPAEPFSNHGDLLALLDELGTEEASLVGLSAGAQVALEVALAAPRRVRRMVLASPSLAGYVPREMPPFFADLGAALRAGDLARANEVLLASSIMAVPPAFQARVRTMVEDNTRLWKIPFSLVQQPTPPALERLATLETPTLVLVGGDDLQAIRAQGTLLERRSGNAQLVTIPGGGHLLNLTSPDAFRSELSAFLELPED